VAPREPAEDLDDVAPPPVPPRRISGWRLWLFRITAISFIPVLIVVAVELSLRVLGFGYPTSAMVTREVSGRPMRCDSPDFARRFFPPELRPEFRPFIFPAEKPPNTYRVFVLGASAALGTPDYVYGFGRILQRMLSEAYPEANIEVNTVAMTAINSHVVLPIARECARHQPDLFIVYLGNNEVVGPFGPGTVLSSFPPNPLAIRARLALTSTRVGQLVERLGKSMAPKPEAPQALRGMTLFLENRVRARAPELESVYTHFGENLADICDTGLAAGAKVILCTVASNLRNCAPFASLHQPGLSDTQKQRWERIYAEGSAYEAEGDYARAVERYLAAAEIDETYADLQFRLGRCDWALGEYGQAGERYTAARDLDTLRFRADTRINQVIRSVAEEKAAAGVLLVDTVAACANHSPYQVPGEELFYEHVHFTFEGNYLLARTVLGRMETIIPENILGTRSTHPLLTEEECAHLLAYTDWDRWRVIRMVLGVYISGPPFTGQLNQDERVKRLEEQLRELDVYTQPAALADAVMEYRRAIQRYPTDWELHWKFSDLLANGLKDFPRAIAQMQKATEYYPYFQFYNQLGDGLRHLGDLDKAEEMYRQSLKITSSSVAHFGLAELLRAKGDMEGAIEQLSKALEVPSMGSAAAYMALADVFHDTGKTAKAIKTLREGIEVLPEELTPTFHYQLGLLLDQRGKTAEAADELREALRLLPDPRHPDHTRYRNKLDELLRKQAIP